MRKLYLDNIRWATVVLVLIYHVLYMFNAAGVLGGVGPFAPVQPQDALLYAVYPWFMLLLFVSGGMSARYALEKKSVKEFIRTRTRKLLVPATLGLLVFQWITGYFNVMSGGGLEYIPAVARYPVFVLSGTGPLWFIQLLWVFSLLLCLLRKADPGDRLYALAGRCPFAGIVACALPIWGAAQILNAPVFTTYRFGIYFTGFLLGYYLLSQERTQEMLQKYRLPLLGAAVAACLAEVAVFWGQNYTDDAVLKSALTNGYAWLAVLAVLGCGRAWLNKTNAFASYMAKSSFGIYVVHYLLVIAPCWWLKNCTALPAAACYLIGCAVVLVGSPLLYELLRRIPLVRYCVLGQS